ncbi:ATP-binding cassette domain-containing protein [Photorhabdus antumapuensis]|uniref:ATP-binding cassette domain-containing protein n=1 Tax=Photorhabdus antumapuensis TaxID=2862867 RepID=UPI001CEC0BE8|nr:ABC transporter ATP-binding protein [Photorhabdus antumapuensis]
MCSLSQYCGFLTPITFSLTIHSASLKELIIKPIPSSGRITIRGPNGAGKSTFLCWLKEQLGESAYYLPAHHELVFEKTSEKNLSTGQELREFLKEISVKAADKIEILMLDEWDANLDLQSRQVFSELIGKLSESLLIVEVRHNV